jgi:hypothetical protein
VPGDVLASCLGLTPAESAAVIAARDQLGRFSSAEERSVYAQLPQAVGRHFVTECCSAEIDQTEVMRRMKPNNPTYTGFVT